MEKYDCKKCEYNTGGVFNRNKKNVSIAQSITRI